VSYKTRFRIILTQTFCHGRDSETVRKLFDNIMSAHNAVYGGWTIHDGNKPHFYLVDDPTEKQIAGLLLLSRSINMVIQKETYGGTAHRIYDLNAVMEDIARVLAPAVMPVINVPTSKEAAQGWSSVVILREMLEEAQKQVTEP
jgi:hypothetical protein